MLGDVSKHFVFKRLLTTPSNVLPLHLNKTFPPIIWVFTEGEGDGIEPRLPFKKFSTLSLKTIFYSKIETTFCLTSSAISFSLSISSSPFVSPVFSNASTACKARVLALIISPAFMSKSEATRRECPSDLFDKLMCESCHLDRSSNFEIGVEYWYVYSLFCFLLI